MNQQNIINTNVAQVSAFGSSILYTLDIAYEPGLGFEFPHNEQFLRSWQVIVDLTSAFPKDVIIRSIKMDVLSESVRFQDCTLDMRMNNRSQSTIPPDVVADLTDQAAGSGTLQSSELARIVCSQNTIYYPDYEIQPVFRITNFRGYSTTNTGASIADNINIRVSLILEMIR